MRRLVGYALALLIVCEACTHRAPQSVPVAVPQTIEQREALAALVTRALQRTAKCSPEIEAIAPQACNLPLPEVISLREDPRVSGDVEVRVRAKDQNEYVVVFSRVHGEWRESSVWIVDY